MFAERPALYSDHGAEHGAKRARPEATMTTQTSTQITIKPLTKIVRRLAVAAFLLGGLGFFGADAAPAVEPQIGATVAVNSWSFRREVLRSDLPVVVEFWAPWCGPCRQLSPRLEQLARDLRGSVKVVRVNTDESPLYTDLYHVKQLPTVLIVRGGKVATRLEGGAALRSLFERLEKAAAPQEARPAALLAALAP